MARHRKTTRLIEAATEILAAHHPQTVRQVFYQLVSRQVIENSRGAYQSVSKALVAARRDGTIPWEQIEDRLRRPRHVSMWDGLGRLRDDGCRRIPPRSVGRSAHPGRGMAGERR